MAARYGYEYDSEYANGEGEDAVVIVLYDSNGEVIDALGGVTLNSLQVSDHGNINLSPEDEEYVRSVAEEMAAEMAEGSDA